MAQSRMAGMAMDLGPSDLADVGEAQTLATNKMGMEQGQQASVIFDLKSKRAYGKNDGKPIMMITEDMKDHSSAEMTVRKEDARYPHAGKPFNYFGSTPMTDRHLREAASHLYN